MKEIRAIILAAGVGRRLMPLTKDGPKFLLRIPKVNIPIYRIILDNLILNNIYEAIIVIGYKYDKVIRELSTYSRDKEMRMSFVYNPYYTVTNTAYSLYLASFLFNKDVLIVNGDTIFDKEIVKEIINTDGSAMALSSNNVDEESVKAVLDNKGYIVALGKKVQGTSEYIGIAYMTYTDALILQKMLQRSYLENPSDFAKLYYDDVINKILHKTRIKGIDVSSFSAIEIDTIEDLNKAIDIAEELVC